MAASICQLVGLLVVAVAVGVLLNPAFGLLVLGIELVAVGVALERG